MGRLSVPRPLWTGVETDRLGPRSVGTGVAGVSPPQARSCQFFLLVGLLCAARDAAARPARVAHPPPAAPNALQRRGDPLLPSRAPAAVSVAPTRAPPSSPTGDHSGIARFTRVSFPPP